MREAIWGGLVGNYAYRMTSKLVKRHLSPASQEALQRRNYRQQTVSLEGGLKLAGATAGSSLVLLGSKPGLVAAVVPPTLAALFGLQDDQSRESESRKGFQGHLAALAAGEVTTGLWKIIGIGSGAAIGALAVGKAKSTGGLTFLLDTTLIAGAANLANLFDLRPGRALKVASLLALPSAAGRGPGAVLAGASLAHSLRALPADLGEREMLGDTGANSLGTQLGTAAAWQLPLPQKLVVAAALVGLNLLSEKVSFSQVIQDSNCLRYLDQWGRPTAAPGSVGTA